MSISKELLSELLKDLFEVEINVKDFEIQGNDLYWNVQDIYNCNYPIIQNCNYPIIHDLNKINIYELAHKCKEWAIRKGFVLSSYPNIMTCEYACDLSVVTSESGQCRYELTMFKDAEPEAIFKACQWILENKEEF